MSPSEHHLTRSQLKIGSGKGAEVADAHFDEMAGSRDLYIYVPPRAKVKGYDELKSFLQAEGCAVQVLEEAPMLPGKGYKAVKVSAATGIIPDPVLRRAHRWAHQRDFLHSFFKPLNAK
ncbi:MAG: hypothetical protein WD533_03740 [Dehalococcoidia bacterium]